MAAHQENIAKLPLKAQTGWSEIETDHPGRALLTFDGGVHPSRAYYLTLGARLRPLLDVEEGDYGLSPCWLIPFQVQGDTGLISIPCRLRETAAVVAANAVAASSTSASVVHLPSESLTAPRA